MSERIQRRINRLLDQAEEAADRRDWPEVAMLAREVLSLDAENPDASALAASARRMLDPGSASGTDSEPPTALGSPALPASFVGGRYRVERLLGRGGRKRVYLAQDTRLNRPVAFALIPGQDLSVAERERALREAQAMARLGSQPHLVAIFDLGDDGDDLYTVQEYMAGGDLASLIEQAPEHQLPLERSLMIAMDICRALEAIHQAGIIHRDLKPANVFLSGSGAASVGDFGLAASAGPDRITQHGTMLGTVAYLPPEQALGGEVSMRSDLYSLGCLLYELVTGRVPFVGEDATSVISQHLNVPPVAPSWLTEHCPPPLEDLILRLLAKVPGDRPVSATEVLAALQAVDPNEKSASHSDSNALTRLARGVFVGREQELDRLRRAFDEALAGHGSLVMLVGEPGIGKTRAAQELETYARMRGAQVLWGRS